MSMTTARARRVEAFLTRWRPILPLLVAEAILWIGFGAVLPVLPLYMTEKGIDPVTLGLVVAAWPAARLFAEPAFGWLADRIPRVPLMVAGLFISTVVAFVPLVLIGPVEFFVVRLISGLGAAMYDPAARGFIVDATADDEHGEAFGLYSAAQMGGFLVGPAIGGIGAGLLGQWFPFVFATIAGVVAALYLLVTAREPERRHAPQGLSLPPPDLVGELQSGPTQRPTATAADVSALEGGPAFVTAAVSSVPDDAAPVAMKTIYLPPASFWNRMLVAAVVINFGSFFASGTYEVVWSLFMERIGASLELIGLSFAIFGIPILLLSPLAGRWVDRLGALRFIVVGSAMIIVAAFLYPIIADPYLVLPVNILEGTGFALLGPAVYAVVSWGSPAGRSSTAQGLFGAAGTLGFIISSLVAGELWSRGMALPFQFFAFTLLVTTIIALAIGRGRLDGADPSLMIRVPVGASSTTAPAKEMP
ncbi:MAG: MFS transporter [Chloroflexota bacterium]